MTAHDLLTVNDDDSITVPVHAQPGAGRTQIAGRHGDAVKVRVAAPPEGGRANAALITVLAGVFGVAEGKVTLVSGDKSRSKRFEVSGVDPEDATRLLDHALATAGNAAGRTTRDRDPFRK